MNQPFLSGNSQHLRCTPVNGITDLHLHVEVLVLSLRLPRKVAPNPPSMAGFQNGVYIQYFACQIF
jgi:hypothetical protein